MAYTNVRPLLDLVVWGPAYSMKTRSISYCLFWFLHWKSRTYWWSKVRHFRPISLNTVTRRDGSVRVVNWCMWHATWGCCMSGFILGYMYKENLPRVMRVKWLDKMGTNVCKGNGHTWVVFVCSWVWWFSVASVTYISNVWEGVRWQMGVLNIHIT